MDAYQLGYLHAVLPLVKEARPNNYATRMVAKSVNAGKTPNSPAAIAAAKKQTRGVFKGQTPDPLAAKKPGAVAARAAAKPKPQPAPAAPVASAPAPELAKAPAPAAAAPAAPVSDLGEPGVNRLTRTLGKMVGWGAHHLGATGSAANIRANPVPAGEALLGMGGGALALNAITDDPMDQQLAALRAQAGMPQYPVM